jgi:serine/threonine protein kinase
MFQPGEDIDRNYRVVRRLATGGAGVTYLVRTLGEDGDETGPLIALKLLFASRDHGAYLRRLATEAQIIQTLHHPHIVEYLGFVHRTGQSPYLLTRFEEGGSLLDHLKRVGTLSVHEAAAVGRQVCLALEKGHAKGIIHRDLKPENLLLTQVVPKGEPPTIRVADFGIAKVAGGLATGLTRAGHFVGTPQYAAPEQFLGEPASDKADVYSLGAVMIFLMTARNVVPKIQNLDPEDAYAELVDALPPSILRPTDSEEICAQMNEVLASAMALNPADRCSVTVLESRLGDLLAGVKVPERPYQAEIEAVGLGQMFPDDDEPATQTITQRTLQPPTDTIEDVTVSPVPTETEGPPVVSKRAHRSLVGVGLSVVALGFLLIFWLAPWWLDGIPVLAPTPVAGGGAAKRAANQAYILSRPAIRKKCAGVEGTYATLDLVVDADGDIRWSRVVESEVDAAACFAAKLRGESSGEKLKKASKVRLRLRL